MHLFAILAPWLSFGSVLAYTLDPVALPIFARAEHLKAAATALRPSLSENATIVLPIDQSWDELQIRGTSPRIQPNFAIVIEAATEEDVQNTVRFASEYGIPFLAVSGAHGWTTTLNSLPHGIQINLRRLNSTTLDPSGDTATIGGGTLQYEANRALFAKGKQAGKLAFSTHEMYRLQNLNPPADYFLPVHTLCECVSVVGPLLGGGHSMLQGRHGYALDNVVSAQVVLANGTAVTASKSSNPDLFWALRGKRCADPRRNSTDGSRKGAGHNFGIVTSAQIKVYDIPSNWTVHTFFYNNDKLEAVLNVVNEIESDAGRPANMVISGVGKRIPPMDPLNVILLCSIFDCIQLTITSRYSFTAFHIKAPKQKLHLGLRVSKPCILIWSSRSPMLIMSLSTKSPRMTSTARPVAWIKVLWAAVLPCPPGIRLRPVKLSMCFPE